MSICKPDSEQEFKSENTKYDDNTLSAFVFNIYASTEENPRNEENLQQWGTEEGITNPG